MSVGVSGAGGQVSLASRETATPPQLTIVVGSGTPGVPAASFTSSASSALAGSPITFTDTSTGNPTSWLWNFGDGATSTLQNPSHVWPSAGTYTVSLTATNAYGSSAPATASITINTDTTPPTTPGGLAATANGQTEIDLGWSASTDNAAVAGYGVYRDGGTTPIATVAAGTLSYHDTPLAPASTHSYTVDAFDAAGNRSTPAGPASATTVGGTVTITLTPTADSYVDSIQQGANNGTANPLRVSAGLNQSAVYNPYLKFDLSGVVGSIQSATLTVTPATSGGSGFSVWRVGDSTWGETTITYANAPVRDAASSGSVPGPLATGTPVSLSITGLAAGAQGGPLSIALTTTGSSESLASRESSTPPTLTVVVGPGSPGAPAASFTSAPSSPLTGVAVTFTDTSTNAPNAWSWSFGDGATSTLQNPSHTWATAGTYTVSLTATNGYGSSSPATAQVVVTNDTTPPSAPGGLTATAAGTGEIDLSWTASTDNKAVTGYDVYRDGSATPLATVGAGATSYADTQVAPASTHSYTVDAFDAAANYSSLAGPAGATTTGSDPQPTFPIRAAFYYPWFPESWSQQGYNPFTWYAPTLGNYDSSSASVVAGHIATMSNAGINAGIASWWGQGQATDLRMPLLLSSAAASSFRWATYYEPEGQGDPSVSVITSDLTYIVSHYGYGPGYLRVAGRPVVFVYADVNDGCAMADRWKAANASINAYIVLKVFPGYAACAS
ncbi:MAG TPA: PKD domain-containing protein, partial [Candidatus Bathyarchaeia archaeon]|nr:PKD domain-containing protein [Candidatus Bathyarchaeia archaeon]